MASKAEKIVEIPSDEELQTSLEEKTDKQPKAKTKNKKILKHIEKATRELDNVLSDLIECQNDFKDIQAEMMNESSSDLNPKDEGRVTEASDVLTSINLVLFYLTERLARKHVGKAIDAVDVKKRKALKK